MKVIQYSTTRCPHCSPAWDYLQKVTDAKDRALVLFDKQSVSTDADIGDAAKKRLTQDVNDVITTTGPPRTVPGFVITDDKYRPITGIIDRREMEDYIKENYKK